MKNVEPIFIDKKSKTGVLMLHGFSSTPKEFEELSAYLSEKKFNVLVPLLVGHGTSPEDFAKTSPEDWVKSAMAAYLKLKKISEKIFIIGNSFGSNVGLCLVKDLKNEPSGIIVLGTPVFLRFHNFLKFRLFTYGRFKKYYKKPAWLYRTEYTGIENGASYPLVSIKNLNEGIKFLEQETMPNLSKIKVPILIASARVDPIVDRKSVDYIFDNIGSTKKEVFWFDGIKHDLVSGGSKGLFYRIYEFITGTK